MLSNLLLLCFNIGWLAEWCPRASGSAQDLQFSMSSVIANYRAWNRKMYRLPFFFNFWQAIQILTWHLFLLACHLLTFLLLTKLYKFWFSTAITFVGWQKDEVHEIKKNMPQNKIIHGYSFQTTESLPLSRVRLISTWKNPLILTTTQVTHFTFYLTNNTSSCWVKTLSMTGTQYFQSWKILFINVYAKIKE